MALKCGKYQENRIIKTKKTKMVSFFCWIIKKRVFDVNSSTSRHVIVMGNTMCTTRVLLELSLEPFTKWKNLKTPTIKPHSAVKTRCKCIFSSYILVFFHFGPYNFTFPLLVPKPINACYFRLFRQSTDGNIWGY